ncbi:epimerase [Sphingomonas sp. Leaf412]|uniref:NAD-dependent epimerase/dehydratase family protein n=1 Tax=Sphingomonas sp. Leaf412 TaxID=1736370 RepID=UPI0006F6F222|nr:NAD(P)-dependent oxidoreductase [Sphingomonas sp. Leaf412]KQT31183.1 epimerase [Sphingomonas sp. Leaf412]
MTQTILAITGGTGFVGARLIDAALDAGHAVRALARRPQPARDGVTWVAGALEDTGALRDLVSTADAVVHIAAVLGATTRAAFEQGNIRGTRAIVDATTTARVPRFVHVSSLAAREPALSDYGWSKAEGERVVSGGDLPWTIVRPPAVYGPGDHEQRDVFRLARLGLAVMPPPGRLSAIHVDDLAALLLALATAPADRAVYEPEGPDGGMDHGAYFAAIGTAVGRRVLPLPLPAPLLRLASRADRMLRGDRAKLTPDRVAYMIHPDWTADPAKAPPPALWRPRIALAAGMADTVRWYRAQGLL